MRQKNNPGCYRLTTYTDIVTLHWAVANIFPPTVFTKGRCSMEKRLILHDWNGCLIDDAPHRYEFGVCAIFDHYKKPRPTSEQYNTEITSDWIQFYYNHGIPRGASVEQDKHDLDAIMNEHLLHAPIPPLFPETREFLDALAAQPHVTQILVSALNSHQFRRQYHAHGLSQYFTEVHAEIDKKSALFTKLLKQYSVLPEEAIGVTDSMSDVAQLAACGIDSIIVPRGYCKPNAAMFPRMRIAEDLLHALRIILRKE
jgi:FMN phosphatase YigB (HAD superfamily)